MNRSLPQKMGLKDGARAILIDPPADTLKDLALPAVQLEKKLSGKFDHIHAFVMSQAQLRKKFSMLKRHLKSTGKLWVSWPKSGGLGTDLNLKNLISIGYDGGLVESTCLRVDEIWSALKFTFPKEGKIYQNSYGKLKR